ncbi:hypothetical protein C2I17_16735 [Niallia circulans]|uniref:glycosyltransferase n=1 Tax=Niallia circulans TaxID=1397 RepID=UPI00201E4F79|nr:glycosyltransferase [Niallia circulans]UQZ76067.1 hypothetical protein C2I17_16735 [Niallia circulans]
MSKIKLGVIPKSMIGWGGGRDFLFNILYSINQFSKRNEIEIILIVDEEDVYKIEEISNLNLAVYTVKQVNKFAISEITIEMDIQLVISFGLDLGIQFPKPWISYIPDFQHKYLPSLFNKSEIHYRNYNFKRLYENGNAVLVNSYSVEDDIVKFLDGNKNKVIRLPFAPIKKREFDEYEKIKIEDIYKEINNRFFIISNQFWVHKSHLTAFKAFKHLHENHQEFSDVQLVCTGNLNDYRNVNYISTLFSFIEENKLEDKIILLGEIPKSHQIALLCRSIALIQPTLFEGGPGGGSTYEAIALNKKVILSNISINKEVTRGDILFFQKESEMSLYKKIIDSLKDNLENSQFEYTDNGVEILGSYLSNSFKKILLQEEQFSNEKVEIINYPKYNIKNKEIIISENLNLYTFVDDQINVSQYIKYFINRNNLLESIIISGFRIKESKYNPSFKDISSHFLYDSFGILNQQKEKINPFVMILDKNLDASNLKKDKKLVFLLDSLITIKLEKYIYEFVLNKVSKDSPIYIYGDGEHTKQLLREINFHSFNIRGILAKNPKQKKLGQYEVKDIRHERLTEDVFLLISSASFETEIYEDLINMKRFNKDRLLRIYGY